MSETKQARHTEDVASKGEVIEVIYRRWGDKTSYLKMLNVQESEKTWLL